VEDFRNQQPRSVSPTIKSSTIFWTNLFLGTNRPKWVFRRQPHSSVEWQGTMPSRRYYRERARTLLAWTKATKDKAYAAQLRLRAANELEQAEQAREEMADLNPLLGEFNARQMFK
jgi:hypothetical protein